MEDPKTLRGASIGSVILIWLIWIILIVILYFSVSESLDENHPNLFLNIGFAGLPLALFAEFKRKNIPFSNYLSPQHPKEWQYLLFFIPLFAASWGFGWLFEIMLYQFAPDYLQSNNLWMEQNPLLDTDGSAASISLAFISLCLVAPVAEEFLFRGIMLEKMRYKWSIISAILLSSFIFGLLHFHVLAGFVWGAVLCVFYLETKSLFVPMGIHFLNNFSVMCLNLLWPDGWADYSNLDYLFQYLWLDISFLLIGSAWVFWFLYSRKSYLTPS